MASYKIYKVNEKIDIEKLFSIDWVDKVGPSTGDLEETNQRIDNIKKRIKSPHLEKNEKLGLNAYSINYEYNMIIPGNNRVWVPDSIHIIQAHGHLFISKSRGQVRFLVEKYLNNTSDLISIDFRPKKLMTLWNNLKKSLLDAAHEITLHRVIMRKTYFPEGDLIMELNMSTKNVEDIAAFRELIKEAEKIRAMTFKIKWNLFDNDGLRIKRLMARLDAKGNLLIYGVHFPNIIDLFLDYIIKSVP